MFRVCQTPQVCVIHFILATWNLYISIRNNVILFISQSLKVKLSPPQTQQKNPICRNRSTGLPFLPKQKTEVIRELYQFGCVNVEFSHLYNLLESRNKTHSANTEGTIKVMLANEKPLKNMGLHISKHGILLVT